MYLFSNSFSIFSTDISCTTELFDFKPERTITENIIKLKITIGKTHFLFFFFELATVEVLFFLFNFFLSRLIFGLVKSELSSFISSALTQLSRPSNHTIVFGSIFICFNSSKVTGPFLSIPFEE